ncbi:phosphatidylinositol-glycan biosynthesis class S protein [Xylariaceae sp. FL0804]|nr:phosphatidylinositol-glycan biosynthesis class S protein [Xylariaceae sp. FL0804]
MSSTVQRRHDGVMPPPETSPSTAQYASNATDGAAPGATPAKRKLPPPEKSADIRRRSLVVGAFWCIVLLLGLPIWWQTTSIYRANLPLDRMMDWADGKACSPVVPIRVTLDAPTLPTQKLEDLKRAVQQVLDATNAFPGHRLQIEVPLLAGDVRESLNMYADAALTIQLKPGDAATSTLHPHLPALEVTYTPDAVASHDSVSPEFAIFLATQLSETFAEEQAIMSHLLASSSIPFDQLPRGLSQEVTESLSKRMTRSLKYSGTFHLSFSLFTSGAAPSSWEVDSAIDMYMKPVLDMLSPIHNFTIDTQVQLYAAPGVQSQVLTKEDLSSFINAAEWPLSPSIGGAPTVNFIVYAGNQTIGVNSETATSQSWLIPQWGSVYLLAPPAASHVSSELLKQPILTFTSHLLSLLGTPETGSLPTRLSTLTRIRSADLLLRASSSLGSLARLSLALPSISIPSSVADGVAKSMRHLELACAGLGSTESLGHARIAEAEAERAFFEKSMVGQLYFPDEHKVAVYLPLLGPVGVPLVMGLLNELKNWKNRRQQKAKTA